MKLRVCLVDADNVDDFNAIGEGEVTVDFGDPLSEFDFAVLLTNLEFHQAGEYRLQLYADRQFLRERRLLVVPLAGSDQP